MMPAFEIFLLVADKIVAMGQIGEIVPGVPAADGAGQQSRAKDDPGVSANDADCPRQKARQQAGLFRLFRFRFHVLPTLPCKGKCGGDSRRLVRKIQDELLPPSFSARVASRDRAAPRGR